MQGIARAIQDGSRAFLNAEYRWLAVFAGFAFLLIWLGGSDNGLLGGVGDALGNRHHNNGHSSAQEDGGRKTAELKKGLY